MTALEQRLAGARNADGGWGYYAGKGTRLEPTCWGILALGVRQPSILTSWPASDGLLLERAGGEPNFGFHGLALLTLLHRGLEHQGGNRRLLEGVQRAKGVSLEDRAVSEQNNQIQAWSWIPATFSWVEPSCYCLLALKKARRGGQVVDASRVADGEAMLYDRCAAGGGWNYGNSNVLGQQLAPYVPTTALALLALQDRRDHSAVRLSLDFLARDAASERSGLALALAMMALRVFGLPTADVEAALVRQVPTTLEVGNLHAIALALAALRDDQSHVPFAV